MVASPANDSVRPAMPPFASPDLMLESISDTPAPTPSKAPLRTSAGSTVLIIPCDNLSNRDSCLSVSGGFSASTILSLRPPILACSEAILLACSAALASVSGPGVSANDWTARSPSLMRRAKSSSDRAARSAGPLMWSASETPNWSSSSATRLLLLHRLELQPQPREQLRGQDTGRHRARVILATKPHRHAPSVLVRGAPLGRDVLPSSFSSSSSTTPVNCASAPPTLALLWM